MNANKAQVLRDTVLVCWPAANENIKLAFREQCRLFAVTNGTKGNIPALIKNLLKNNQSVIYFISCLVAYSRTNKSITPGNQHSNTTATCIQM